jgi:ABC-type multidrug transport system permease subunit
MRWMLKKDLLILARSRVMVAILVLYPVAVALLIGLAISRAPAKPKVAIANLTPPGATVELGGTRLNVGHYYSQLFSQVQPIPVATRAQAVAAVQSGRALAGVVIPANIASQLSSVTNQGHVEVIYNGDALEQSFVHSTIEAALSQANLELSNQIRSVAARVIGALVQGGSLGVAGAPQNLPGLSAIPGILRRVIAHQPHGADRAQLERLATFSEFAAQNLGVSREVLSTVSQPIQVQSTLLHGQRTPLDTYAVVVAVSISLMFVCVLLAAGGIALEREEHTLARLARGLISRELLIAEKLLLAACCSALVAFAMLAGIGAFVGLDWSRVAQWIVALAVAALAFAALGVAIGALAREVRAASLLAFLLSLPLAFLALVPAGAVAGGVYDVIRAISLVFPFKAALQALDAAVNSSSPGLGISLLHLLALTALFGVLARVGLRRAD